MGPERPTPDDSAQHLLLSVFPSAHYDRTGKRIFLGRLDFKFCKGKTDAYQVRLLEPTQSLTRVGVTGVGCGWGKSALNGE